MTFTEMFNGSGLARLIITSNKIPPQYQIVFRYILDNAL